MLPLHVEWTDHYRGIKSCNLLLSNIDRIPDMDEGLKNRMKAEARVLRAFQYFQLMTWFGDVPLFEKDITIEESRSIQRSPRAEVLAFVLKELDESVAGLPANSALPESERGRITKGAAIALKARVLLYESRWADVVSTCELLINNTNNGTYSLFPSYEGLFLPQNEYNSEVILDVQFVPLTRMWGTLFITAIPGRNRTEAHKLFTSNRVQTLMLQSWMSMRQVLLKPLPDTIFANISIQHILPV